MKNQVKKQKAIVIGSGFGGLSLAIRLQAQGYVVEIFEKRAQPGGRAYQIKDSGYTFDMGPTLITAPQIIDAVFARAGKRKEDYVNLQKLQPFYRVCFHDGTWIDYTDDHEALRAQMAEFDPKDAANLDRFFEATAPIYDAVITEGLGGKPFDTIGSMFSFLPKALKLKAWMPVTSYVKQFFKDPRHQFLFSFHPLFIGGNPFKAPSVYMMIPYLEQKEGVWYAEGGMYSLVQALVKVFQENGGRLHTSAEVEQIVVENGQARGIEVDGQRHEADIVVSNADTTYTYKNMIAPEHRSKWSESKLDRLEQTMSAMLIYVGVRKKYPQLRHHTIILAERYKELLQDIFDKKILPDDFSLYLHTPSVTDPSMAPEGSESMYILAPVANLQSGIDWEETGPKFAEKILSYLEEWGLEDLRDNIEVMHTFTPEDFRDQLNSIDGNAFGVLPKLSQTAYFRPHNRSEDIEGLYFVGAGTHPGAGVPGVMLSAEATERCILADAERQTMAA